MGVGSLDVCRDTDADCSSCPAYPVSQPTRDSCMKTCGICTTGNVALNKSTNQNAMDFLGYSYKAVDGNNDGNSGRSVTEYEAASCTHTGLTSKLSWWCVDLEKNYTINNIIIYSRDVNQEYLRGFELRLSSDGSCNETGLMSSTPCYTDSTTAPVNGQQEVFNIERCNQALSTPLSARYLFINVTQFLTLCEVEIFTAECSPGYYSTSTTCEPCDKCSNNSCNRDSGVCTRDCKSGFHGTKCDNNCPTGCSGVCDKTTGNCNGCTTGFYGTKCDMTCSPGCFSTTCSQTDGSCTSCKTGLYGSDCSMNCSGGCKDKICMKDGNPGLTGTYCQVKGDKSDGTISPVVTGVIGVIIGVVVGVISTILLHRLYKRQQSTSQPREEPRPTEETNQPERDDVNSRATSNNHGNGQSTLYENQTPQSQYETLNLKDNPQSVYTCLDKSRI